jgi:serine/threonine protein kinase
MICARCARQVAAGAFECPNCGSDPLLDGRYRLDRELASDPLGASWQATRIEDELLVRARACLVRRLGDGPEIDDRLARIRSLEHAALPRRLDAFVRGEASLATHWLIDEHIVGPTLASAITAAPERRLEQRRVVTILRELGDLLAHLQRQPVPIVHGAMTPELILLGSGERGACLLDLGLASAGTHASGTRGLADSLGFAAPEQLYADATAAADVWALGAIAVVALSGARLASLRDSTSALRWREHVEISTSLAAVLERMLDPDPERRIRAAELVGALTELDHPEPSTSRQHPWTPNRAPHTGLTAPPKPVAPRSAAAAQRNAKPDVPVMRPDELSRELSQAHQATVALEQQQRSQLVLARVLVVVVAALIAALTTYIALG